MRNYRNLNPKKHVVAELRSGGLVSSDNEGVLLLAFASLLMFAISTKSQVEQHVEGTTRVSGAVEAFICGSRISSWSKPNLDTVFPHLKTL